MNPFDRVDVLISKERLTARPINFSYDKKGEVVEAVLFETTCPGCGSLIQFSNISKHDDGLYKIGCGHCGVGAQAELKLKLQQPNDIIIRERGQRSRMRKQPVKQLIICPFIDPVVAGSFDPIKVSYE